jgi:hypothetical protein
LSAMQLGNFDCSDESLVTVSAQFEFKMGGTSAKEKMSYVEKGCPGSRKVLMKRVLITHSSVAVGSLSDGQE